MALTVGIAIAVALLVLLPVRRLHLGGWRGRRLELYFLGTWALAVGVAVVPVARSFLAPFLLVAYLAPFIALREGLRAARRSLTGTLVRVVPREPPRLGPGDGTERPAARHRDGDHAG